MADGELRLMLDESDLARLRSAAAAAGLPLETYARRVLVGGDRWAEARRRIAEYRLTGEAISVEEALAHFDQELDAALQRKR